VLAAVWDDALKDPDDGARLRGGRAMEPTDPRNVVGRRLQAGRASTRSTSRSATRGVGPPPGFMMIQVVGDLHDAGILGQHHLSVKMSA
jgi:hypothetical protein